MFVLGEKSFRNQLWLNYFHEISWIFTGVKSLRVKWQQVNSNFQRYSRYSFNIIFLLIGCSHQNYRLVSNGDHVISQVSSLFLYLLLYFCWFLLIFRNSVIWIVFILLLISNSFNHFAKIFGIIPSAPIMMGTKVVWIQFFQSSAKVQIIVRLLMFYGLLQQRNFRSGFFHFSLSSSESWFVNSFEFQCPTGF